MDSRDEHFNISIVISNFLMKYLLYTNLKFHVSVNVGGSRIKQGELG